MSLLSTEEFVHDNIRPYGFEDSNDLRGFEVYDRNHKRVGIISEIYCCAEDLQAKYIEIVPFDESCSRNFIYPFDMINWHGNGPAFLLSTHGALRTFAEYDADKILSQNRNNLISYNEALDHGLEFYWQSKECA